MKARILLTAILLLATTLHTAAQPGPRDPDYTHDSQYAPHHRPRRAHGCHRHLRHLLHDAYCELVEVTGRCYKWIMSLKVFHLISLFSIYLTDILLESLIYLVEKLLYLFHCQMIGGF